jgi:hypothetical protein
MKLVAPLDEHALDFLGLGFDLALDVEHVAEDHEVAADLSNPAEKRLAVRKDDRLARISPSGGYGAATDETGLPQPVPARRCDRGGDQNTGECAHSWFPEFSIEKVGPKAYS